MKLATIVALAVVGLLAIACTETTVVPADESTTGVSVSGEGSVFGQPDVAVLTLGVEAEADSVGQAREDAAGAMDAMLATLRDGGVDDDDIQTSRFSVQPQYDYREARVLTGFVVNNIVTVKIRSIDDTGELIDAAVVAGGDLARVESLQFTIDDPSELQNEARRLAMQDAKAKAETLADEAGIDIGAPLSISESGGPRAVTFEGAAFALDEAAAPLPSTAVEIGELEVQIQVQVVYGLDN